MKEKIMVTSALPYANGDLHIGHILEFVQADIWTRYNKEIGKECTYISGIDSHGTPIMLKSASENVSFEKLINNYFLLHKAELKKFSISLDNYYTTHSYENELFSKKVYRKLYEKGFILEKTINQFYDVYYNMFLPDRYVIGSCPKCKVDNQYGDVCEKCNNKYDAIDLLNPISILSKSKPIKKDSIHYFFNLKNFNNFLLKWCSCNISQKSVVNKLMEWLDIGLKEWDISRDYPYFGFKIPGEYKRFFYVWLDAPIGYISFLLNFLLKKNLIYLNCFREEVKKNKMYHFIGKDIIYFHALFWPAVINGSDLFLFADLFVHGFVTVNNLKMSKSGNTFINAKDILSKVDADCLRFYIASKLNDNVVDIDFNFSDFSNKVNSDLVGKFLNVFSRCSKIIIKNYNSFLSSDLDIFLFDEYLALRNLLLDFYKNREYNKVVYYVMKYTDKINLYLDNEKPWILVKSKKTYDRGHSVCTTAINLFFILLSFLKPIMPNLFDCISNSLNINLIKINSPVINIKIANCDHIIKRY